MPKKVVKKKGKKKAKKSTDKGDDDENKFQYDIPEYKDPLIYTPKAKLKIQLAQPISINLSFTVEVFITVRVEEIKQMIIDRHDGAI